jgi:8-oxo-dGTP diphosphatase
MEAKKHTYDWPRPAVTVDVALFTAAGAMQSLQLRVLLIRRGEAPFVGHWALPGGFVREAEGLEAAARRELLEETGLGEIRFEQVCAVGTPGRDPRGHTITVLYAGLARGDAAVVARGDASEASWFAVDELPALAFDHEELLRRALAHLRRRLGEAPICDALLPAEFTLGEFQRLVEVLLGREVDRRNFRRKVECLVEKTGRNRREGAHRPAELYRFVPGAFERAERELPF